MICLCSEIKNEIHIVNNACMMLTTIIVSMYYAVKIYKNKLNENQSWGTGVAPIA